MDLEARITAIREQMYQARARQKWWAVALCILGLVTLADSGSPFPIPLVGLPSILAGLGCLGTGYYLLYRQQELPITETLEIAALYQGYLSAPLLIRALHVTPETAERILDELVRRGYARIEEQALESGEMGYRVVGLEAPAPPALPPG
jgi:hypothetical protein